MSDPAIQGAMTLAQSAPVTTPHPTDNLTAAKNAAKKFEGAFISQLLNQMFAGIPTNGPFGGGPGESMFRSLMLDQYGQQIADRGGFGLSGAIMRALLSHQEAQP